MKDFGVFRLFSLTAYNLHSIVLFFCLLKFFLVFICFTFVKYDRSWFLGAVGMTQFWTQSRINFLQNWNITYLRLIWSENEFRISFLRTFTNFPTNENQSCVFLLFIFIETIILIVGKILKIRKIWNSELVKKIEIYCRIRWTSYLPDI